MLRNLTLVAAAVLLAGAGFAAGLLVQRSFLAQPAAGDAKAQPPRKDFDELLAAWKYPGAKLHHGARGGELHYSVSTTADDVSKVGKHYEKLIGTTVSAEGSAGGVTGIAETMAASGSDSLTPDNKPRSVQATVASRREKDYVVTIHISRSKDEDATHIVLSFAQQ